MDKTTAKHFALGAGIGLFVGAVVAVLVAPKKGKEVRAAITDKLAGIKDKVWKKK